MNEIDAQPTIDDFLTEFPTTITSERTGPTPTEEGMQFNWRCTLTHVGRSITVDFHAGIGHALEPSRMVDGVKGFRIQPGDKRKGKDGFWYIFGYRNWQKCVVWPEPDVRDLIGCLAINASCIDNGETFIEFAREMGYESLSDYEEARKAYDGCHEALAKLRTLYGREATERLMYETEGR